jgi:hypothetical protein
MGSLSQSVGSLEMFHIIRFLPQEGSTRHTRSEVPPRRCDNDFPSFPIEEEEIYICHSLLTAIELPGCQDGN